MTEFVRSPSGLILPERIAKARYAPRAPVAMEFFAGCGGMACGLKQAGWHVIAAAEYDCIAAMTYAANLCRYGELTMHFVEPADEERMNRAIEAEFKRSKAFPTAGSGWIRHQPGMPGTRHLFIGDVRKLSSSRILDVLDMKPGELDAVAGGPPCQGFSVAGKREVMDPRNSLVFEFARFIVDLRPKTMVFENVPAIASMVTPEGVPVIEAFCRILQDGGFSTLDALKRTLAAQAGAVGFMRSTAEGKKRGAGEKSDKPDTPAAQMGLFDEVAA